MATHRDLASRRVVEAEEEPEDGALSASAGPHDREAPARRDGEGDPVQHRPAPGVWVGEGDVLEGHLQGSRGLQLDRPRLVHNGRTLLKQREHVPHVDHGLPDLPVRRAQEVERKGELEQQAVDQHEVPDGARTVVNPPRRHQHCRRQGSREDQVLAEVQKSEGALHLDRGLLVPRQAPLVFGQLVLLVAKVLDGLVVDERVQRDGRALVVRLVHLLPELRPPLRGQNGEQSVRRYGAHRKRGELRAALVRQHPAHQAHLKRGGEHVEDKGGEDKVDPPGPPVHRSAQRPGLPRKVVRDVKLVQVLEDLARDALQDPLRDLGEDGVPVLVAKRGGGPHNAIRGEHDGGGGDPGAKEGKLRGAEGRGRARDL
mmetsp:Transcript_971/g.3537  ORF Transcript_971/g.3537 Transcript_971/m.3537 type:complete len:371 (+) Transcript_971:572-1684(+)